MKTIVLASTSPRRKELLFKLGIKFVIDPAESKEDFTPELEPYELAKKLSLEKARSVAARHPDSIIIAADTLGVLEGRLLGKPKNDRDAIEMLRAMSGKMHRVITGFTILDTSDGKSVTSSVETKVHLRKLDEREIEAYVNTGEPADKAGAYAIQGLGSVLVERIDGDFYNVIGLPLSALVEALKESEVRVL